MALTVRINTGYKISLNQSQEGALYKITGFVKTKSTPSDFPTFAKVRLYRDVDGIFVAQTWSNATTGAYSFECLSPDYTYTAIAYDPTLNQRAEAANNITPVPM